MPTLALRISVSTLRGTTHGAPRLAELLHKHGCGGTFLFSMGPDASGKSLLRALSPKKIAEARRTQLFTHLGGAQWTYGTLRPAPNISASAADAMRAIHAAGFECGVHGWDSSTWDDALAQPNNEQVDAHMQAAHAAFVNIFQTTPRVHGAQHWHTNAHALRTLQRLGYTLASDTRGKTPHYTLCKGEPVRVLQLPTTMQTFAECIGRQGATASNVATQLFSQIGTTDFSTPQVLSVSAEREGLAWLPWLETLISLLHGAGIRIGPLSVAASEVNVANVPYCDVSAGEVEGRAQSVMMQGIAMTRT
jgi:undecaprenyl phosphate-alpha-L-ara4FN deformylase